MFISFPLFLFYLFRHIAVSPHPLPLIHFFTSLVLVFLLIGSCKQLLLRRIHAPTVSSTVSAIVRQNEVSAAEARHVAP